MPLSIYEKKQGNTDAEIIQDNQPENEIEQNSESIFSRQTGVSVAGTAGEDELREDLLRQYQSRLPMLREFREKGYNSEELLLDMSLLETIRDTVTEVLAGEDQLLKETVRVPGHDRCDTGN